VSWTFQRNIINNPLNGPLLTIRFPTFKALKTPLMKNLLPLLLGGYFATVAPAQQIAKPAPAVIASLPDWVQEMYAPAPNVFTVDSLYSLYYSTHPFEATAHTAYYRIWRHSNLPWIVADGHIRKPSPAQQLQSRAALQQSVSAGRST
jgi:hypothetical protein